MRSVRVKRTGSTDRVELETSTFSLRQRLIIRELSVPGEGNSNQLLAQKIPWTEEPGGPWEERKKLTILTASSPVFCLPKPRGTNPARNSSSHWDRESRLYDWLPQQFGALCEEPPLSFPTQAPAELRQATEMAGARKKSENSPTSQVPGDNPSSHCLLCRGPRGSCH